MKFKVITLWIVLSSIILPLKGQAVAGNFDWEPFRAKAQFFEPIAPGSALPMKTEKHFQDLDDYIFSFSNDSASGFSKDSTGLQFDFHNVKFSISRYALNLDRDHTINPSDLEKQKQNLIDALPSVLQSSSFSQSFETMGKIFEPNINLHIEF